MYLKAACATLTFRLRTENFVKRYKVVCYVFTYRKVYNPHITSDVRLFDER